MHKRVSEAIRVLHPLANLKEDVVILDDGDGPRIVEWHLPGEPPTDAEVDAIIAALGDKAPPPLAVFPAQAKITLYQAGLYDQIRSLLAADGYEPMRIYFDSASVWERFHPYLLGLATELGLTDEQVDDLFRAAAAL